MHVWILYGQRSDIPALFKLSKQIREIPKISFLKSTPYDFIQINQADLLDKVEQSEFQSPYTSSLLVAGPQKKKNLFCGFPEEKYIFWCKILNEKPYQTIFFSNL